VDLSTPPPSPAGDEENVITLDNAAAAVSKGKAEGKRKAVAITTSASSCRPHGRLLRASLA